MCTAGWRVSDQLGQNSFLIIMIYDHDDDNDDDDDDGKNGDNLDQLQVLELGDKVSSNPG